MRTHLPENIEKGRIRNGDFVYATTSGMNGGFIVRGPSGDELIIVSDAGDGKTLVSQHGKKMLDPRPSGWEHVSVMLHHRTPTWAEMAWVKDQFWNPEECVIEYHPPESEYVRCNPYRLHLWRPKHAKIPMPPKFLVSLGFDPSSKLIAAK